jgi:hypothetical protein
VCGSFVWRCIGNIVMRRGRPFWYHVSRTIFDVTCLPYCSRKLTCLFSLINPFARCLQFPKMCSSNPFGAPRRAFGSPTPSHDHIFRCIRLIIIHAHTRHIHTQSALHTRTLYIIMQTHIPRVSIQPIPDPEFIWATGVKA